MGREKFKEKYRAAVGGLFCIAKMTRPDISDAVREVACGAHDLAVRHWEAIGKILSYLRSTSELRITFCEDALDKLRAFADSSHELDSNDERLASGSRFVFCAGSIIWL